MDATLNYYLNRLGRAEIAIKNIEPELLRQFCLICNDSYKLLQDTEKLKLLMEYARILDNYYEAIADACDLCIFLRIDKPPIFLNNLVKTLLPNIAKECNFLNKEWVALGCAELSCNLIKDCEKIMQQFYDLKNIKE